MIKHYKDNRLKRKARIRARIFGTEKCPRISVFRSNKQMFVQFIDDKKQKTLLGLSDREIAKTEKNKLLRANKFAVDLSQRAVKLKITKVVFDRSGYKYSGRVKVLAEGLRKGGLIF